jgi:cytochrome c553
MLRLAVTTWLVLALGAAWSAAGAGDPAAGQEKAINCAACHGERGVSVNEFWPHLAGQQAGYLARQLRAFRDGARREPLMTTWVSGLTDADIDDLAAWFASLAPPCRSP